MLTSSNMNLTIWDDPDDLYDHSELAANWQVVDDHDHTSGNGVQIPTNGLANSSVTNAKLATNAVTTDKVEPGTLQGDDLAPGTLTLTNLSQTVLDRLAPIGQVIAWFRPTTDITIPTGWRICDGSVVGEVDHDWTGAGNVTLPDLRNKFVLGAATSGTGTGTGTPPAENTTGGAHTRNLTHSHTVAGHTHTVNSHTHTIGSDGGHVHGVQNGSRGNSNIATAPIGTYPENIAFQAHTHIVDSAGTHSHGGATGGAASATSSVGLTTDSATPSTDFRPSFVGLLYIIKISHGI